MHNTCCKFCDHLGSERMYTGKESNVPDVIYYCKASQRPYMAIQRPYMAMLEESTILFRAMIIDDITIHPLKCPLG